MSSWPPNVVARYRSLGLWTDETLSGAIRRNSDDLAIVAGHRRLSYRELFKRVDRIASGLLSLGFRAGDVVILHLPNCVEFFEVSLALWDLGVIPVMALPGHRLAEISAFAQKTAAKALLTSGRLWQAFEAFGEALMKRCPSLSLVVDCDSEQPYVSNGARRTAHYITLTECEHDPQVYAAPPSTSVALLQLSGGSTGTPKLIPRTHADYLYSVRQSVLVCEFDSNTTYLAVLPVAHNFPLSSPGALGVLLMGGTLVLAERPTASLAFEIIRSEKVTVTALVPPLLQLWLTTAALRGVEDLASLDVVQVGGARLDPGLARKVPDTFGCTLQQVFGMAEGLVCYTRKDDPPEIIFETQGRPMSPFDELRVVDDDDRDVSHGHHGHLLTRGPYTIRGYYNAPNHNRIAFTSDGYYRTGDIVKCSKSGYIEVCGRSKDQVNRGGEKVSAPEVEAALCRHPNIDDAAVVPVPDRVLGERTCAFIVPVSHHMQVADLRAHFEELGLANYKAPDLVKNVAHLPLTTVGKIDKKALARMATETGGL